MATEVKTTCPYCGVGCGVIAKIADDGAVTVKGDPDHPANLGRLCSKGSALAETIDLDGRLLHPQVNGKRVTWDSALDLVASKFSEAIAEHGPDSVAFYVSGQLLTEDYYVANKLMKGFIGSANIDTNSRLCMSSSVAGHRRAFGSDTVPGLYEDIFEADLVILTGSNLAWCHPVIYQRLAAAKVERPHMRIAVVDPRRTMTCDIADMHLAIRPDGDVALFNGLLAHLATSRAIDQTYVESFTSGFDAAVQSAGEYSLTDIAEATGLTVAELTQFYDLFERTQKTVTCYSQGVNQSASGTDKVNAIINCHLVTGRIGRPGMGPFSLTGQPNAMGGREVGGLANMLAAHMHIENIEDRNRVQRFWGSPAIAGKPGLKAVDMFKAVADGRIKAIWIMATNPVVSMPDASAVEAALRACPFVVVSDIMQTTDTTRYADVLLPSLGWGEKDGTVTNSERCISRQRSFLPLPDGAMADWRQLGEVAQRMGFGKAFDYKTPADIFAEHAALSAFENHGARDFDIGACSDIAVDEYESLPPFTWPRSAGQEPQTKRFFANGNFFHSDGRARFITTALPRTSRISAAYPLTLNTGRIRDQWHTMTRTGKSTRLSAHMAEPFVEIHPRDAMEAGIETADLVKVESPLGEIIVRALVTERQRAGNIFVPMHWNDQFAANARVDKLVPPLTDAFSGQPASKNIAVKMQRFDVKSYGFAVSSQMPETLDCAYWAVAKAQDGWRLELGFDEAPDDWTQWTRNVFAIAPHIEPVGYADRKGAQVRLAFFDGNKLLAAIFIADTPVAVARSWAVSQLSASYDDIRARFGLVAGRPGAHGADPGATVCSCFGVGINQITAAIRDGCRSVESVGAATCAGTNCGSCRAEIRGLIDVCLKTAAQ
ncbi:MULTISPECIES: nitrate reductase [unclassified Rhizobium]|uniref:nitrate reductase n=1 Tax=unclassified Rhizobium TaxID=2613769 RepID=UPI00178641A9|nr:MULTISPECIES: nitrate reductase [unclassified Rhizobium]MBD8689728.1 molybdopterin-dependent oxidoreductase [Rhizobium sp. CFBP 13644]MBD8694267.1 molybdopterin-dependent oxidoreductase [Rhizobium sp. CFBP 13717]